MSGRLNLVISGLWALAITVSAASLGLIVADREGLIGATMPLSVLAAPNSAPPALPLREGEPLFPFASAALPPVVIPLEFGPSPSRIPPPPVPAREPLQPRAEPPMSAPAKPPQPTPEPAVVLVLKALPERSAVGEAILISVADRKLRVLLADGSSRNYPIAVGRSRDLIPIGTTEVLRKRRNPTWVPTPEMRRRDPKLPVSVPPGPRNPMGLYALDLGWTYYRIHGTNEPQSIGRASSSGCFRMLPKDIEAVFKLIDVGTKVTVIEGRLPNLPSLAPPSETKAL
jgi:lipoprotein-anchoring transpeptidase ErfK/SrfK